MLLGQAIKKLKIGRSTFLHWEKSGVIPPAPRARNGWRIFNKELIEDLNRRIHPEIYPDQVKSTGGKDGVSKGISKVG